MRLENPRRALTSDMIGHKELILSIGRGEKIERIQNNPRYRGACRQGS